MQHTNRHYRRNSCGYRQSNGFIFIFPLFFIAFLFFKMNSIWPVLFVLFIILMASKPRYRYSNYNQPINKTPFTYPNDNKMENSNVKINFCKNCGSSVELDATFCSECGFRLI